MAYYVYFWKKAPFVRLLPPLVIGILSQWHFHISTSVCWYFFSVALGLLIAFHFMPLFHRFRYSWSAGGVISVLLISTGMLLASYQDLRNDPGWLGKHLKEDYPIVAVLNEPLVDKPNSYKAEANVEYLLLAGGKAMLVRGKILVYFQKNSDDSLMARLLFGTRIVFAKPIQAIRSTGNPAAFDFERYCLYQGITHQVFLKKGEFGVLAGRKTTLYQRLFYSVSEWVLGILRRNIHGKKEYGLAEALLIGYRNDLDRSLVQSYSNTGVVHVVAISGLHIGLIYWLLGLIFRPFRKYRCPAIVQPVVTIGGLWAFSLLAGGQPSVLRSAVMFTCVVLGQAFSRKTSIYNSLALSAFLLLCYDPYWLWDIGFQLSYSAVLSIVIFMKPVYHIFYIKNKLLDMIWQLNAVTLAAQILTLPLTVYHFHQFPLAFLLTNIVAVPLSSVIVLGEILLCAISFTRMASRLTGELLSWLIRQMNHYIEWNERLPGTLWEGLQIDTLQVVLLFLLFALLGFWIMEKRSRALIAAMGCLLAFAAIRAFSFWAASRQCMVIVYNVPRNRAIDFVDGRRYYFAGDTALLANGTAVAFHLRPARIKYRLYRVDHLASLEITGPFVCFGQRRIVIVDSSWKDIHGKSRGRIDLAVLSRNPALDIKKMAAAFDIGRLVFDGSVSQGRKRQWKRDCDSLGIPWYDVSEQGAFMLRIR